MTVLPFLFVLFGVALSWPTTVTTSSGAILGSYLEETNVNEFLGIPYASPPTEGLRWKPPVQHPTWKGVRNTQTFSHACIQQDNPGVIPDFTFPPNVTFSEDCLTLNVWAPNTSLSQKPVMVWIHGGGLHQGGNSELRLRGMNFASMNDVVVVNINYRLGLFGFLAHPDLFAENPAEPTTGNYGLQDQRLALQWVQQNIYLFGGDFRRVTIAGESAGGTSVCLHLVMPKSAGLFSQAIIESSACFTEVVSLAQNELYGKNLQNKLGCEDSTPEKVLECMRSKSAQEVFSFDTETVTSLATVDGYNILTHPYHTIAAGNFTRVPTMAGDVANEGTLFIRGIAGPLPQAGYIDILQAQFKTFAPTIAQTYPCAAYNASDCRVAYAAVIGDFNLGCPTMMLSKAMAKIEPKSYGYLFSHVPSWSLGAQPPLGAYHSSEIAFVFSTLEFIPYYPHTQDETELAHRMTRYWGSFVNNANPNYNGEKLQWPALTPSADRRMDLNIDLSILTDYNQKQCAMWIELYKSIY